MPAKIKYRKTNQNVIRFNILDETWLESRRFSPLGQSSSFGFCFDIDTKLLNKDWTWHWNRCSPNYPIKGMRVPNKWIQFGTCFVYWPYLTLITLALIHYLSTLFVVKVNVLRNADLTLGFSSNDINSVNSYSSKLFVYQIRKNALNYISLMGNLSF